MMRDGMRYGCWPAPAAPVERERDIKDKRCRRLSVDAF